MDTLYINSQFNNTHRLKFVLEHETDCRRLLLTSCPLLYFHVVCLLNNGDKTCLSNFLLSFFSKFRLTCFIELVNFPYSISFYFFKFDYIPLFLQSSLKIAFFLLLLKLFGSYRRSLVCWNKFQVTWRWNHLQLSYWDFTRFLLKIIHEKWGKIWQK